MAEPDDLEIDSTSLANSISSRVWNRPANPDFQAMVTEALAEQGITLVRDKNYQGDPERGFDLLKGRLKAAKKRGIIDGDR